LSLSDAVPELAPFEPAHAPLLAEWLVRPHVARWHPEPKAWVDAALNPPPDGAQALIVLGVRPIGYLRWRKVSRETLDTLGLLEIPAGGVDIDILIGEADCVGRGLGPRALAALVEMLRRDRSIPSAGLSPSIDNVAAQRAYAKVGFHNMREYDAPGFGRLALMMMELPGKPSAPERHGGNA
jgi:aminoglycoside 6'-N-acetyltransferase